MSQATIATGEQPVSGCLVFHDDIDIERIATSGQSFRWRRLESAGAPDLTSDSTPVWQVVTRGHVIRLTQGAVIGNGDGTVTRRIRFSLVGGAGCSPMSPQAAANAISEYLDMGTDYRGIRSLVDPSDGYLREAAEHGRGIRILRQDPWEALVSFIISQRKSVPAISTSVRRLCEACGTPIGDTGEHAFPSPGDISEAGAEGLSACGLGYRLPYVLDAARTVLEGTLDLAVLAFPDMADEDVLARLMVMRGVGIKVASCTALFGLHRLDMFPVDVWMRRVLDEHYPSGFPFERYTPYNGVTQQWLFEYARQGNA